MYLLLESNCMAGNVYFPNCIKYYQLMKNIYLIVLFLGFVFPTLAQNPKAKNDYSLLVGNNFTQSKNYYLLTLFQNISSAKQLLSKDTTFQRITNKKIKASNLLSTDCQNNVMCFTEKMKFSKAEIQEVSTRYRRYPLGRTPNRV